ncbi:MAG: DnaJ like chaperone protein [Crocinitomix sp.]|jgi:DnaJ like chaperone protein
MIKVRKPWIGLIIGFIFGAIVVTQDEEASGVMEMFVGGMAFSLFGLLFYSMIQMTISSVIRKNQGFLKGEKKFLPMILMLAAEVVKADGKIDEVELEIVQKRLAGEFEPEVAEMHYESFKSYLNKPASFAKLGKIIDYEFNAEIKAHLLYLLISIATADGVLSDTELKVIQKIAKCGNIRPVILIQTLKLFEFKREQTYRKKSEQAGQSKSRTSSTALRKAHELLGVSAGATMDEIKKAYRKLAKIHHPDKVAHLGELHQTKAKEKFQIIVDAYDMIKENRGA